jgi:hypothetical protein
VKVKVICTPCSLSSLLYFLGFAVCIKPDLSAVFVHFSVDYI